MFYVVDKFVDDDRAYVDTILIIFSVLFMAAQGDGVVRVGPRVKDRSAVFAFKGIVVTKNIYTSVICQKK